MRVTRKIFSSKNLINAIEEKAFNEGYLAAQREFAEEEEDESRDRKRKIGKVLAGVGAVGAGAGTAKTLADVYDNSAHFDKRIKDLVADNQEHYNKRFHEAQEAAKGLRDKANSRYSKDIKELQSRHPSYALSEYDARFNNINNHRNYTLESIDSSLEKEVKAIEEKFGYNATQNEIKKLKETSDFNRGKIIKSGALKYGLPALAVTGIGAGMMYKNRKKKDKE